MPGGHHGKHAWRRVGMTDRESSLENRRVYSVFARVSCELRRVSAKHGGFHWNRGRDGRGRRRMNGGQRCREVPGDVTAGSAGAPARASTQVSEVLRRVVRDGRDSCRCTSARRSASANDRRGDHERRRFRWQSCAARCRGRRAKRGGERGAKRARGCCGCRRTSVNIVRRLTKRKKNGPRHPRCFGARRGPCSAQAAMRLMPSSF